MSKACTYPLIACRLLNAVTNHWSFAQWGNDIVGPLPTDVAKKKLLIVAIDYSSKWVEVGAYANIKDKDVTKFV